MLIIYYNVAYCNRLSVKMASENSSEDEFGTLHYLLQFSSPVPDMTYNVFGGTLSLTWYSINQLQFS